MKKVKKKRRKYAGAFVLQLASVEDEEGNLTKGDRVTMCAEQKDDDAEKLRWMDCLTRSAQYANVVEPLQAALAEAKGAVVRAQGSLKAAGSKTMDKRAGVLNSLASSVLKSVPKKEREARPAAIETIRGKSRIWGENVIRSRIKASAMRVRVRVCRPLPRPPCPSPSPSPGRRRRPSRGASWLARRWGWAVSPTQRQGARCAPPRPPWR